MTEAQRITRRPGRALLVLALLLSVACAGGRGQIAFDGLEYPASMSGYLYGPDDRPLSPRSLEVVGEFRHETRLWGALFSWIPLTGRRDFSDPINREIRNAGGEGVINLAVHSHGCAINYIPALSLLPIWPGCAQVAVEGEIVKRKPRRRRASAHR